MSQLIDLKGRVFGRLAVQKRIEDHTTSGGNAIVMWECICSCGKYADVSSNSLSRGKTKSCGCLLSELAAVKGRLNKIHGGYSQSSDPNERIKFPAVDRKNSNLPYLKKYKSNLMFISHRANRIKSNATIDELQKILLYLQTK